MRAARLGPLGLELCFPCSGGWFDHGELPTLVRAGPEVARRLAERFPPATAPPAGVRRKCPVCRLPLEECEFPSMPGIPLAGCGLCQGFWVGVGQLQEMAARFGAAHLNATSTRDIPEGLPDPPSPPTPAQPRRATGPADRVRPARPARPAPTPLHQQLRCPSCGEANDPGAPVCWACGGFMPTSVAGRCPSCAAAMRPEVSDDVELGFCPECGGVWLEEERLTRLRSQPGFLQDALLGRLVSNGKIGVGAVDELYACPACRETLLPADVGMISAAPIFTCPRCFGTFLEGGRLAKLVVERTAPRPPRIRGR